ncbi:MAG: hypothetical protein WAK57_03625 [Desulfobacterales bacterium]|jgi:hypothetical protein
MSAEHSKSDGFGLQLLQGVLPIPTADLAGTAAAGASDYMALWRPCSLLWRRAFFCSHASSVCG